MPQTNPQAEIQNILTDTQSVYSSRPPQRKMRAKTIWLVIFVLLIAAAIILVVIMKSEPKDKGLSRDEKAALLNELKTNSGEPATRQEQAAAQNTLQTQSSSGTVDKASAREIMGLLGPQGGQQ